MRQARLRFLVLAWCCVGFSACILRPEKWPEDLAAGDVTGTAVGTPPRSSGQRPLAGARVRLKGTSLVRSTRGDGRFEMRNLPPGGHTLLLDWQEPGATAPQLSARVAVDVRVSKAPARASRNLGRVVLGSTGSIRGRVTAPVGEDVRLASVVLTEGGVTVHPAADGTFLLDGLAAGPWRVVAALGALMSAPRDVTVEEGRTLELDGALDLQPVLGTGTLRGKILGQPAPDQVDPVTVNATLTVVALAGGPAPPLDTVSGAFGRVLNVGLYAVGFSAPNRLAVVFPHVLVMAGEATDLDTVWMLNAPGAGCVDLDGDGACYSPQWTAACAVQCRAEGPGSTCTAVTPAIDCDDDADGELDVDEAQGPLTAGPGQQYGPCACGILPLTHDGAPCDNNPSRADRDFDGVCDAYDPWPLCALNSPQCDDPSASDGGVPDGGGLDAGEPDASMPDGGGPDAASGVEHSVVNPGAPAFLEDSASTAAAQLPSGDHVLAGFVRAGGTLMLGANCTHAVVSTRSAFVVVSSAAGACVQSWVFPGAILLGMDASTDGAVFVALGTPGELTVEVGGTQVNHTVPGGPSHVHLLRLDAATPDTWRASGVGGGWSSDFPAANGLRSTPEGGVVAWGRSDGVTMLTPDTTSFAGTATTAWVEQLDATMSVLHLEVWTGTDVNPSPQAVSVHSNGTILLAGRARVPVQVRQTAGSTGVMMPLSASNSAYVRSWTSTAQATQVVPFNGTLPFDPDDAIVAVAPTPNGARLAARLENCRPQPCRPPAPFAYGPGLTVDAPGWQAVVEAEYGTNGVPISVRVVTSDPRSGAGAGGQEGLKVLMDESGNTFVLGQALQGTSVWIPGEGFTELRRTGEPALGGYLLRINAAGVSSMVLAEASAGSNVMGLSMARGPADSVVVNGGFSGTVTFGAPPACSTAAVTGIPRTHATLDPFSWTVPREAFDLPCAALPFTPGADAEPGAPDAAPVLPSTAVDVQAGDVDCFTFTPSLPGHHTLTATTPQCVAPLTSAVFPFSAATATYAGAVATGTSPCDPLAFNLPASIPLGVCVEGALGGAVPGVQLSLVRDAPPPNDECAAAASVLDVSGVFTGGLPFLLLPGTTVNATPDALLPDVLHCGWGVPAMDVFHRLQGSATGGTVMAALRQHTVDALFLPRLALLPDSTCPDTAQFCSDAPPASPLATGLTPNATLVVHGEPGNLADQSDYQLLVLNADPMTPMQVPADTCADTTASETVDLALNPTGVVRLDLGMLNNDVTPQDLSGPVMCGNPSVANGADGFLLMRVPAGGTVTLVAAMENAISGPLALSLLDTCATTGPHCLAQEASNGTFDSLTWTNAGAVPADVVILVETSVPATSATFARLAWELH